MLATQPLAHIPKHACDQVEELGNTASDSRVIHYAISIGLRVVDYECLVATAEIGQNKARQIPFLEHGVKRLVDCAPGNNKVLIGLNQLIQKAVDKAVEVIIQIIKATLRGKLGKLGHLFIIDMQASRSVMMAIPGDHPIVKANAIIGQQVEKRSHQIHFNQPFAKDPAATSLPSGRSRLRRQSPLCPLPGPG